MWHRITQPHLAVLEARDAVAEITRQPAVNVNAACSGGIITAVALAHLAATGEQDKFGTLTTPRLGST